MLQKLSIVTLFLVVIGGIFWYLGNDHTPSEESKTIISELDTEKLSRIVIQGSEGLVELVKAGDQWIVKSDQYPADTQKINDLILDLLKTKLEEKVTDNIKYHERFHLIHIENNGNKWEEDKTGKLISLQQKDDSPLLEILIGKNRSSKDGYRPGKYIRYANRSAVFLITQDIQADTKSEDWLDTNIINVESDAVKTVELQYKNSILRISRENKEADWVLSDLTGEEKTNQSKGDSLSGAIRNLTFNKVLPKDTPNKETGRDQLGLYTAELFDGRVVKMSVGKNKTSDDNYFIAVAMALNNDITDEKLQQEVNDFNLRSNAWLYGVNSWIGERFLIERSDIIEDKEKK